MLTILLNSSQNSLLFIQSKVILAEIC